MLGPKAKHQENKREMAQAFTHVVYLELLRVMMVTKYLSVLLC